MAALTNKEKEEARLLFDQLDTNKDGKLSFAEFTQFLQFAVQLDKTKARTLFDQLDLDKSGGVSCEEFLKYYETLKA